MTEAPSSPQEQPRISVALIALGASAVLAYGYVVGGIYLLVFWRNFGVEPFQHGGAADLMPAGIAAVAVSIILVFLGAAFGSFLGRCLHHPRVPIWAPRILLAVIMVAAIVFIIWGPYGRLWLIGGVLGQIFLTALLIRSPLLPEFLRSHAVASGIAVTLAYAPASSAYFADREALRAASTERGLMVDQGISVIERDGAQKLKYVGRLKGDSVLYDPCSKRVWLVPVDSNRVITLAPLSETKTKITCPQLPRKASIS